MDYTVVDCRWWEADYRCAGIEPDIPVVDDTVAGVRHGCACQDVETVGGTKAHARRSDCACPIRRHEQHGGDKHETDRASDHRPRTEMNARRVHAGISSPRNMTFSMFGSPTSSLFYPRRSRCSIPPNGGGILALIRLCRGGDSIRTRLDLEILAITGSSRPPWWRHTRGSAIIDTTTAARRRWHGRSGFSDRRRFAHRRIP